MMTDALSPSQDFGLPSFSASQSRDRAGSMSRGNNDDSPAPENGRTDTPANEGTPVLSPVAGPSQPHSGLDVSSEVQDVLTSEIGISTLLNRLKQSVTSAKEFSLFLKKRSILEEEHAHGMRKLCRMTTESMRRPDHREGSFFQAYEEMMVVHERIAQNGIQFAESLLQMHDDLVELAAMAEKGRKGWKAEGLAAEQRVADIEAGVRKSKAKYDALADEYDRVRTGDSSRQSGKMFTFKGPKSGAQHEEDLLRKVQGADQDYAGRVQTLQAARTELLTKSRPDAVKALSNLVQETDAGVSLQVQKFASFNEKLLLSNGLTISPLKAQGKDPQARSLREIVGAIDNEKDLQDYITHYHSKVPPKTGEPRYERNPVLGPHHSNSSMPSVQPMHQMPPLGQGQQPPAQPMMHHQMGGQPPQMQSSSMGKRTASGPASPQGPPPMGGGQSFGPTPGSRGGPGPVPPMMAGPQRPSSAHQHERSFSHASALTQFNNHSNQPSQSSKRNSIIGFPTQPRYNGGAGSNLSSSSQGPPQLGALSFQTSQTPPAQQPFADAHPSQQPFGGPSREHTPPSTNPLQQHPPGAQGGMPAFGGRAQSPQRHPQQQQQQAAPTRPVFGITLQRLYERDGGAVPMVVVQCIQAVDLFGLSMEGIYRLSGSLPNVNKLKSMFDTDSNSAHLDFRNPENFFHDVNSVAGLMKQFFRDLPDPLLTREHYANFIDAARSDDDIVRRDSLHAIINSLPDPNYATLRHLTLHLRRVMDNSATNRMSCHNLAIVFGPTLMGSSPAGNIADAGWQVRVVDTILQNTYDIFDED